jgi:CheY-like chemotaxis protein
MPPASPRILVVEDETMVAMLLEDILEELGCTVIGPAVRVTEALEMLEAEPVDGALLDVNLLGETSYRIADALAQRDCPFVFTTGYGAAGLDEAYRDRPVLQKPFTRDRLAETLAAHVFR